MIKTAMWYRNGSLSGPKAMIATSILNAAIPAKHHRPQPSVFFVPLPMLTSEGRSDWLITVAYADTQIDMATMDSWEAAMSDLDATVARVPGKGVVEFHLHLASVSLAQAIAVATSRTAAVTAMKPTAVMGLPED